MAFGAGLGQHLQDDFEPAGGRPFQDQCFKAAFDRVAAQIDGLQIKAMVQQKLRCPHPLSRSSLELSDLLQLLR